MRSGDYESAQVEIHKFLEVDHSYARLLQAYLYLDRGELEDVSDILLHKIPHQYPGEFSLWMTVHRGRSISLISHPRAATGKVHFSE